MRTHLGLRILILVVLAVVGIVSRAQADQADRVTWTLEDVTALGTSISGSFVFNAHTGTYSDIDITTTGGSIIPDETWTSEVGFGVSSGPAIACCLGVVDTSATNQTGANTLMLVFSTNLTDAGGAIPIEFTEPGACDVANCYSVSPYYNNDAVVSGTGYVVASVYFPSAPEPGTLMLLATGLLVLLGLTGRRKFFAPRGGV